MIRSGPVEKSTAPDDQLTPPDTAVPHRADRPGVGIRRREAHPLSLVAVIGIARSGNDRDVVVVERRDFIAQTRSGKGTVEVGTVSQGQIDRNDIVGRSIGDHPLQRLFDVAKGSAAGIAEDFEHDDVAAGSHAGVGGILRADDARDVGAVAICVVGVGAVRAGEVERIDDAVGDAVVVGVRSEEWMIEIDPGVENDDGLPLPVDAGEPRVGAKLIEMDQRSILLGKGLESRCSHGIDRMRCGGCGRNGRLRGGSVRVVEPSCAAMVASPRSQYSTSSDCAGLMPRAQISRCVITVFPTCSIPPIRDGRPFEAAQSRPPIRLYFSALDPRETAKAFGCATTTRRSARVAPPAPVQRAGQVLLSTCLRWVRTRLLQEGPKAGDCPRSSGTPCSLMFDSRAGARSWSEKRPRLRYAPIDEADMSRKYFMATILTTNRARII